MKRYFAMLLSAVLAIPALAADPGQIVIATGSGAGTYNKMLAEFAPLCTGVTIVGQTSAGSVANLDALIGNQINAAFVQEDVLFSRAMKPGANLGNVKSLFAFHPEEVHFVALAQSKVLVEGDGVLGRFKKQPKVFTSVTDLESFRVGAVAESGSAVTADLFRRQSEIGYKVVEFDKVDTLVGALTRGEVEAIVLVGGQPLGDVAKLGPEFKLLTVSEAIQKRVSGVYAPANVSYSKMKASGVPTVATRAVLATRSYKSGPMLASIAAVRACLMANVASLQDTTGTHPKWQQVDPADHGRWAWYELPKAKK